MCYCQISHALDPNWVRKYDLEIDMVTHPCGFDDKPTLNKIHVRCTTFLTGYMVH